MPLSEILTLQEDMAQQLDHLPDRATFHVQVKDECIGGGIPMVPLHGQFADREHRSLLSEDNATLSR